MALIIELNRDVDTSQEAVSDAASDATTPRSSDAAEVILFPGVRYERWDNKRLRNATSAPAMTRDWLEI